MKERQCGPDIRGLGMTTVAVKVAAPVTAFDGLSLLAYSFSPCVALLKNRSRLRRGLCSWGGVVGKELLQLTEVELNEPPCHSVTYLIRRLKRRTILIRQAPPEVVKSSVCNATPPPIIVIAR